MVKQTQEAYIVAARRTPVGKARGALRHARPDDMLAHVLKSVLSEVPTLDRGSISDVIVGCAMPEAEQGLNVARMGLLLADLPDSVPGVTVNRFCASGLQAVAMAADRIRLGEADAILAGGTESMSLIPMMGNKVTINPAVFTTDEHLGLAYGMGLTAEKVAQRWQISRASQDEFALQSHRRAVAAIEAGEFSDEICPYTTHERRPGSNAEAVIQLHEVRLDEGPRRDADLQSMAKLRPVFAARGTVTAANTSQMSDGAAAVLLMSERALVAHKIEPLARFVSFAIVGVPPDIMGIGPVEAIPRALAQASLRPDDLAWIELNEAFAAQSLAVIRELDLNPEVVNPLGGAIALGHPLGATGAVRTATLVHGLRRHEQRYGMVTMCVGSGMGAAGVFERL